MSRGIRLFGQPAVKDSPVAMAAPEPTIPCEKRAEYERSYRLKRPAAESETIKLDVETGAWFRPYWQVGPANLISQDNLEFFKVWKKHAYDADGNHRPLTLQIIKGIRDELNFDSDLWDDIYDNDDVFRSVDASMDESIAFYMESERLDYCFRSTFSMTSETPYFYLYVEDGVRKVFVFHNRYKQEILLIDDMQTEKNREVLSQIKFNERNELEPLADTTRHQLKTIIGFHCEENKLTSKFHTDRECKAYIRSRIKLFKLYIYMRRCAILYRETTCKQPFFDLIHFLRAPKEKGAKQSNFQTFKSELLRVDAVGFVGENWNTGLHEWLTCDKTLEALNRTAGLRSGVEPCIPPTTWVETQADGSEVESFCPELNWLDVQMLMRTPTKYVQLVSALGQIETGHPGAVNRMMYPSNAKKGSFAKETSHSPSSNHMHWALDNLLMASCRITDYVFSLHRGYQVSIFNDETAVRPVAVGAGRYLVDGTRTDDLPAMQAFQQRHLVGAHSLFHWAGRDMFVQDMIARRERAEVFAEAPELSL